MIYSDSYFVVAKGKPKIPPWMILVLRYNYMNDSVSLVKKCIIDNASYYKSNAYPLCSCMYTYVPTCYLKIPTYIGNT